MNIKLVLPSLCIFIIGCANTQTNYSHIQIPEKSVAADQPGLANSLLSAVDQYLSNNEDCRDWTLQNIIQSKALGQLVFTQDGQLYHGSLSESWEIMACGTNKPIEINVRKDQHGGNIIGIKRLY